MYTASYRSQSTPTDRHGTISIDQSKACIGSKLRSASISQPSVLSMVKYAHRFSVTLVSLRQGMDKMAAGEKSILQSTAG
jgi:hypothetical protein